MRKILFSFVIVIILVMASQALAGFKVNVPEGWTREDSGRAMILKSQSSNASVVTSFNSLDGADFTEVVERLYIQMRGRDLAQDDDGDYSFSFTNNAGVSSIATVTNSDGYYLVITLSGLENNEAIKGDIEKILESLDYEDEQKNLSEN